MGSYQSGDSDVRYNLQDIQTPLDFALYGLDRPVALSTYGGWVKADITRPILNLGPGKKHITGTEELDWPDWNAESDPLPFPDGSVGGIFATHLLEHLADPRPLLREAGRVLASACPLNILVPHGQSLMFAQDLDHKRPFVIDTWRVLLFNPYYDKDNNEEFPFEIGANFTFALAERNTALVTQLIRKARR